MQRCWWDDFGEVSGEIQNEFVIHISGADWRRPLVELVRNEPAVRGYELEDDSVYIGKINRVYCGSLVPLPTYDTDVRFKSDGVTGDRIMLVDQIETELPKLAMSSDEPY